MRDGGTGHRVACKRKEGARLSAMRLADTFLGACPPIYLASGPGQSYGCFPRGAGIAHRALLWGYDQRSAKSALSSKNTHASDQF